MNDYTNNDAATLAAIHKLLSERRDKLTQDIEKIDAEIGKVCEARAYVLYGVRVGSVVRHPEMGENLHVVRMDWFHNLARKPSLTVRRDGLCMAVSVGSDWELVES